MMGMENMGHEEGHGDIEAKLQVLQEIKDLMDSRLGDSMKGGVSMEKVSMDGGEDPVEESSESPALESAEEGGSDSGLTDEEKQHLMGMYSKLGA